MVLLVNAVAVLTVVSLRKPEEPEVQKFHLGLETTMGKQQTESLLDLLKEIRSCQHCESYLEFGPRPVLEASGNSQILIVGQAPGRRVHESGVAWDDPSGDRLREWMGLSRNLFYKDQLVAIVPMGFCYPSKGKSGDLPPRAECAELWHD